MNFLKPSYHLNIFPFYQIEIASPLFHSHRAEPIEEMTKRTHYNTFIYFFLTLMIVKNIIVVTKYVRLRLAKPETKIWNNQSSTAIKPP